MSVNRYLPHLYVIPEDDADAALANGFWQHHNVATRKMQVLPEAGGWLNVLEDFEKEHLAAMRKYEHTRVLLLIDFDEQPDRLDQVRARIPDDVRDRVFVLGVWSEPEELGAKLEYSLEGIGAEIAANCPGGNSDIWSDELLEHNVAELERLRMSVSEFLFV